MSQWDEQLDWVIVGSGAGGMASALRAHSLGMSTVVIEKSEMFGGTSAMSGGALWVPCNMLMKNAGLDDSKEEAMEYLSAVTKGKVSTTRLQAYLDGAEEMVRFLEHNSDVKFNALTKYPDYYPEVKGGKPGGRSIEAAPFDGRKLGKEFFHLRPPHPQECIMGRVMMSAAEAHDALFGSQASQMMVMKKLAAYFLNVYERIVYKRDTRLTIGNALVARLRYSMMQKNIPLWLNTSLQSLVVEQGNVVGVEVLREGKKQRIMAKKGVLLAAGGFALNRKMRDKYQKQPITTEWTAASREDTGDAIQLGIDLGAATDLMEEGWWTPTTVVPGESLPWILVVEKSLPGSLMVNQHGKRFTNEAAPYLDVVQGMYNDHDTTGATVPSYLILDAKCRRKYPLGPVLPGAVLPESMWKKRWKEQWITKCDTLEELAEKLGINQDGLLSTVRTFNGYCETGKDEDFGRGDSLYDRYYANPKCKPNPSLAPIKYAPFYAIPVWPGDLGTKGGLVTDEHGAVLRPDGGAIAGLYAAGNTSASVMGETYPGAGGTIGPAMTFGFLAAQHASKTSPKSASSPAINGVVKESGQSLLFSK
jgi:3-oxosteroid 1-dehydrogenase